MERRANKKTELYITDFKNNIRDKSIGLGINHDKINILLQYVYDYERLVFDKDDFVKRKRVKNSVPCLDRCCAKRANDEQCTRRKRDDSEYCGTHLKGTPHGDIENTIINQNNGSSSSSITSNLQHVQKIEIWGQDIQGIIYYLDKNGNVYQAEDIIINKCNPNIIGKYTNIENNYSIQLYYY